MIPQVRDMDNMPASNKKVPLFWGNYICRSMDTGTSLFSIYASHSLPHRRNSSASILTRLAALKIAIRERQKQGKKKKIKENGRKHARMDRASSLETREAISQSVPQNECKAFFFFVTQIPWALFLSCSAVKWHRLGPSQIKAEGEAGRWALTRGSDNKVSGTECASIRGALPSCRKATDRSFRMNWHQVRSRLFGNVMLANNQINSD